MLSHLFDDLVLVFPDFLLLSHGDFTAVHLPQAGVGVIYYGQDSEKSKHAQGGAINCSLPICGSTLFAYIGIHIGHITYHTSAKLQASQAQAWRGLLSALHPHAHGRRDHRGINPLCPPHSPSGLMDSTDMGICHCCTASLWCCNWWGHAYTPYLSDTTHPGTQSSFALCIGQCSSAQATRSQVLLVGTWCHYKF